MAKNKTTKEFKNFKMTPEVFKLRRKVINVLYELKNMGYNLPRIDVRIGQSKHYNTLALERLNDNIMWISERAIEQKENNFYHTILHEIIHTIYGCEHNEKCPLMSATLKEVLPKNKCLTIFKNYYNKYNNKHQQQ